MTTPAALSWAAATSTGTAGSAVALGKLTATVSGGSASILQTLLIDGLPPGAYLTDGLNSFTAGPDGGLVDVTNWNLSALSITLPNTDTFTLTAVATTTDGAGNLAVSTATEPVTIASGGGVVTAASSSIAPELPGLFAGYAVRPTWQVAGVDYGVGLPTGTTLLDPANISMAGVGVNASTHTIDVTGNNVTLSGYDFSLEGGWMVYVSGANDVIENSNFQVGANLQVPINAGTSSTNLSVLDNTINGSGLGPDGDTGAGDIWSLITDLGTGLTVEYNLLENAPVRIVEFASGTLIDKYNLIENVGYNSAAHVNYVEFSNGAAVNSVIAFNTIYNPPHVPEPTNAGEGIQVDAQNGGSVTNTTIENNTVISPGPTVTNSYLVAIHEIGGDVVNGVNVESNFLDSTGAYGAFYPTPTGANLTFVNNVDMTTGSVIAGPSGTASSNVSQVAVTSGSGTATAGTTVTIAVSLNEVVTVSGVPTLSLNDGGTASYSGGSGSSTLTFSHTVSTSNAAVSALAITGFNLPAGATIVDAMGDNANLSAVTQSLTGAPAIAPGSGSSGTTLTAGTAIPVSATSGVQFGGNVATFADSNASDAGLAATITWGDGGTSAGTVTEVAGTVSVSGTHTYANAGSDAISVVLKDASGASATAATTATVVSAYKGNGDTVSATEGTAFTGAVASFTDANTSEAASAFTATIAWGDGTSSAGVVTGSNGSFTVAAGTSGHVYTGVGSYVITTTVTDTTNNATLALVGSATSTDPNAFKVGTVSAISATAGTAYSGTIATFTDSDTATPASSLAATIAWGDGTTSAGTITDVNGAITVAGTHTYTTGGVDTVSVTLKDTNGNATATATTTATVASAYKGSGDAVTATEGTPFTGAVATFTDTNTSETASAFTATIAWGDGTTSAGVVTGGSGSFSVTGGTVGHVYSGVGNYTITTTVTDTTNSATLSLIGSATSLDPNVFAVGSAAAISATAGTAYSGTIATFTDTDTATPASSLAATIVWGDGTTSTGTVTDVNGAISVAGTHTYAAAGTDTVSVTLKDTGGSATATATSSATVAASASVGNPASSPLVTSPATPAQLPGLFSGYAVRPSWSVAGVDYAVGVPATTVLKDPSKISMAGVSVSASSHVITVSGNNVTLNGYDFSLGGGWRVNVTGANDTIENSNFKVGTRELVPITASSSSSNLSILYNTIDGGGATGTPSAISSLISDTGTGLTVEYNWLKNAPQHVIEFKKGTLIDEYNLIQTIGFGASSSANDVSFAGGAVTNSVISFNTIYNPPHADEPTNVNEGIDVEAQLGATVTNTEVENNTIISPGPALTNSFLIAIHQDSGNNVLSGVNVQSNFIDSTGAYGPIYPTTTATNVAIVNNVNLDTGSVISAIAGTASSNVSAVAVTSGGGTVTAGGTITIAVTMNEAMTVAGAPTLSLNDGGIATYTGGSGTKTLTFSSSVTSGNISVPALAITQANLPSGASIVDAAGDNANLSGVTQTLTGAPAVAPATSQSTSNQTFSVTSAALIAPVTPSGSANAANSGVIAAAVTEASMNSLAFIAAPSSGSGSSQAGSATPLPSWLGTVMTDPGTAGGSGALTGFLPSVTPPQYQGSTGELALAVGSSGTALPLYQTSSAALTQDNATHL